MAWLKVSFPSVSKVTEAFVPVCLARLAASAFAERGPPEFFAEVFLAFGFFIGCQLMSLDRTAQVLPGGQQLSICAEQPGLLLMCRNEF
jgi:hypothetical protein